MNKQIDTPTNTPTNTPTQNQFTNYELKQIDEMAKLLRDEKYGIDGLCKGSCKECFCLQKQYAERLYNAGYRRASEVAREIFEEIEKALSSMKYNANTPRKTVTIEELKEQVDWVLHEVVPNRIADLKKKYESEGVK